VLREKVGEIQDDSKVLSEFPFIGHRNPDKNLESPYRTAAESNGGGLASFRPHTLSQIYLYQKDERALPGSLQNWR
jgi:hypothetical protein